MSLPQMPLDAHRLEQAAFMLDYEPFDPTEEEGPAESWPWWTDAFVWEEGPDPEEGQAPGLPGEEIPLDPDPEFEPCPEDAAWWARFSDGHIRAVDQLPAIVGGSPESSGLTDADWGEYARWADRMETLEAILQADRAETRAAIHRAKEDLLASGPLFE